MPYHTMYPQAPKDRINLVYWLMCLLGISALLPYNVMLTEAEYFIVRTHQPPTITALADNFETVIVNCYTIANVLTFLLLVPFGKHLTVNQQMLVPLWSILLVVSSQAGMALAPQLSGKVIVGVTLAGTALLGIVSAIFLNGVYALASWFPPIYIQAVVAGHGVAGLAISLLSFVTTWRASRSDAAPTPQEVSLPAFEYFSTAATVVALGLLGYLLLPCIPFVQFWNSPEEYEVTLQTNLPRAASWASFGAAADMSDLDGPLLPARSGNSGLMSTLRRFLNKRLSRSSSTLSMRLGEEEELPLSRLIVELRGYNVVAGLCFMVTLFAFPGITASICSIRNPADTAPCASHAPGGRIYGDLFTPLTFLMYNLGDFLGRSLAGYQKKPLSTAPLIMYAVTRAALIPALAFCNVITPHPWIFFAYFKSDIFPITFILLLGLTNGHLATLVLMHAPSLVPESLRERCGTVMSFSLTCGITMGSLGCLFLMPVLQAG